MTLDWQIFQRPWINEENWEKFVNKCEFKLTFECLGPFCGKINCFQGLILHSDCCFPRWRVIKFSLQLPKYLPYGLDYWKSISNFLNNAQAFSLDTFCQLRNIWQKFKTSNRRREKKFWNEPDKNIRDPKRAENTISDQKMEWKSHKNKIKDCLKW